MSTQVTEMHAPTPPKLKLKFLVDRESNRVLFAEAGKDAVDFLLGLLRIPLGLAVRLLEDEQVPISLASIYNSVKSLDESYLVSPDRDVLLNPRLSSVSLPLIEPDAPPPIVPPPKKYYRCSGLVGACRGNPIFMTDVGGGACPSCRQPMVIELRFLEQKKTETVSTGYVKELVRYLVMDDLTIMPMSTISAITLLNKFQVKDLSLLFESTEEFGVKEGLEMLKASIQSTTALTDVYKLKTQVDIHRSVADTTN